MNEKFRENLVKTKDKIIKFSQFILKAIFPPRCLICKSIGKVLCDEHSKFKEVSLGAKSISGFKQTFVVTYYYDPKVELMMQKFKYQGRKNLGSIMAKKMAHEIIEAKIKNPLLVPIPLHWTRFIWRGYNQSHVLAQKISKLVPGSKVQKLLLRRRRTVQQAKLDKISRGKNLHKALRVAKKISRENIVIVDDVLATGSTLKEAARAFSEAKQSHHIYAVVFAVGGGKEKFQNSKK